MESAVVSDVFTGGENSVSDVAEGAGNALVITFKAADEEVQYILDHTGNLGDAIKGFLKKVELEAEHLLAWLAEKLGWDDILKVQKTIERIFNDGMDKMPSIINNLKTKIDAAFKTIKTDLDLNIQQARKYFGANSNLIAQSEHDPAALDKAHEHTDWLMSKVTSDSGTSASDNFAVPEPPKDLKDMIEKLINRLSKQVGDDTTLKNAIENLKQDFQDIFKGSLLDAPNKIILIALDLVEIIADVALDIVNTLVDVLLDCFSALLKWFQETVNTPIELPFIMDIYKNLAGEQLTILSFTSLMIAIPAKFIAEFFDDNLALMTSSASQTLNPTQMSFAYCYAGCQFVHGILNIMPSQWTAFKISQNVVDFIAQLLFGSPTGDTEIVLSSDKKAELPRAEKFLADQLEIIWGSQWILFLLGSVSTFIHYKIKREPNKANLPVFYEAWQEGLEPSIVCILDIFRLALYWLYNDKETKYHQRTNWNNINTAYALDTIEGIAGIVVLLKDPRITNIYKGGDLLSKLSCAVLYAKGNYDKSSEKT
jgi:hypothetical protein